MTESLDNYFGGLPDSRVECTKRHKLIDTIGIALSALIYGADKWIEVEEFGPVRAAWLGQFLELANGIPSHDTYVRVFARLDADAFRQRFIQWVPDVHTLTKGQIIAIDGKTVRRTRDKATGKRPFIRSVPGPAPIHCCWDN